MALLNMGSCWNELMLNNAASERLGLLMDLVPIQLTSYSADTHNTIMKLFFKLCDRTSAIYVHALSHHGDTTLA